MIKIEQYFDLDSKIKKLKQKQAELKQYVDILPSGKYYIGKYVVQVNAQRYDITDTKKVLKQFPDLRAIVKTVKRRKVSYVKTK